METSRRAWRTIRCDDHHIYRNPGITTPEQNLESSGTSLLVFGNGDGGGGPLAKMLENVSPAILAKIPVLIAVEQLRRIRATSNKSRDLPPVNMGHSVDEFFDVLAKDSNAGAKLPNWSVVAHACYSLSDAHNPIVPGRSGELYLEVS